MSEAPVESGADGIQPAPRRTGFRHFDVITSIAAIFISAVSLYVAVEHGKTERQLVAANVWPFARAILNNGGSADGLIQIGVSNGGVGPAKIRSFELFYRGQPVSSELDLMRKCCDLPGDPAAVKAALPAGTFEYSLVDETVLRPGENTVVLQIDRNKTAELGNRLALAVTRQIGFRVCYCSVLDQCWMSNLQSIEVRPVRECTPPEHPYNPNGR
jgi:hypothetical protein